MAREETILGARAVTNNEHIYPDIGDLIEFWSDKYTDKGPATGTVTNTANEVMCVKFGDEYQWLSTRVDVRKIGLNHKGKVLWQVE